MRQYTQSATKEARNIQLGTCEGCAQLSQSRPSDATLMPVCACSSFRIKARTSINSTQLNSLVRCALTPSLSLSPHAATPTPRPQEIPQGCCGVCLPSSFAASCFRQDGLVQQGQGSIAIGQQSRARWLPKTDRDRPTVAIALTGSSCQWHPPLFARSAPRAWRQRDKWGTATPWVGLDYSADDNH